jgi:hypothetical protein
MTALATMATMAVALSGCHVRAHEPVGYVEVTSGPLDVSPYPYTYYDGRPNYYVDGRWMYRDGSTWYTYREPPPELYRQRPYIQQAPPAYRAPQYQQQYPQPYQQGPQGYPYGQQPQGAPPAAPPATRVQ